MTPEGKVKRDVTKYLTKRGHFWLSHNTMGVYDAGTGKYRKSPYLCKGESDLMVCPKGELQFIFMELKAKRGKLSADQLLFRDMVQELGFEYAVVRSVDDCVGLGL